MTSPFVLKIAVPVPLRGLFDYLPPKQGPVPVPGSRCEVEFGHRKLIGVVWDSGPASQAPASLKRVRRVIDDEPVLDPDLLALCQHVADYYHHPLGEVVATALPVLVRQGEQARVRGELFWCLTERGRYADPDALTRAPRQQQALRLLLEHPRGMAQPMLAALGITRDVMRALEARGWVELREAMPESRPPTQLLGEVPLSPGSEQLAAIRALREATGFAPYLLDGITGSGKTEVYLQAMEPLLEEGRQVLVLVPEIGLTPQTVRRFERRFNVPVVTLHSGLTDRERLHGWARARSGEARVVLGTRSAIFTPMPALGMVIVDEAHDLSFKQQDGLRYHARDLAVWRARLRGIPVVLGSATPSLETLQLAHDGRYRHLPLRERAGAARLPVLKLEDCRGLPPGMPLSPRSLETIGAAIAAGQQALVFINRRGYAPVIQCHDCGWQAECARCSSFLTWHRRRNQLLCHHCGHQRRVPRHCPSCGSANLFDAGSGTEKIADLLQQQFPAVPVIRVDRDSTSRKGALDRALERVHSGEPAILVGTQMLAKGHHFGRLVLAVILDADGGFLSADFRGPEHASQLILQVAGRTGRGEFPGEVLIQSRHPEHPLLHALLGGDYRRISEHLLEERRIAGLPPFGHLALIRSESLAASDGETLLGDAARQELDPRVQVFGPVPAPMERRQGRFRHQLLLRADHRAPLHQALDRLIAAIEAHPLGRKCRWHVDVDPQDLL